MIAPLRPGAATALEPTLRTRFRYDCLLTCAAADVESSRALAAALTRRGLRVFLPDDALMPGEFRDDALPEAQRTARFTVPLVSPRSGDDFELQETIAHGVRLGREGLGHRVLPVLFDGVNLPFVPFASAADEVIIFDRHGSWTEVARVLERIYDADQAATGPGALLVDALLKGVQGARQVEPLDPELVGATAAAVRAPGEPAEQAQAVGAVLQRALAEHPPTGVRLLQTLAEAPEAATESRFAALEPDALRDACLGAWAAHPADDAQAWVAWAVWAERDPAVADALGVDPVERARRRMPRGDTRWGHLWRRLWALRPGDAGLAADGADWLQSRRRPPALWVAIWEELLAGLDRDRDRAVLLLLGARWLRGREDHPAWATVWRTIWSEPGGVLGISRAGLLRIGRGWLDGSPARAGWVGLWQDLLGVARRDPEALEPRSIVALGRAALSGRITAPEHWGRVWRQLFVAVGGADDQLVDLATDWMLEHEDDEAWAPVWQTLLDVSGGVFAEADRTRLLRWGRAWLAQHTTLGTWPVVMERLLDEGVREPEVLALAQSWLAERIDREHPALAARLLVAATAQMPCDRIAHWLSAWLASAPDEGRRDAVYERLNSLTWDGIDRRGWGLGWAALLARLGARRSAEAEVWHRLEAAFAVEEILEGRVHEVVKGGLTVDLGVPAFMPASQIDRGVVHDRQPFVGRVLRCRIIRFDRAARRVVVSRTVVLEARRQELLATLTPGEWVEGTVRRLEAYGAFVDLGGVDGMVHVSEVGFGHVRAPADRLRIGQRVQARVLEVDSERGRIALSLKDPALDPWMQVPTRYRVGQWIEGQVTHLAHYGAFVELSPGVDGMIHRSEMSWGRVPPAPTAVTRVGARVRVRVLAIDRGKRRLKLSLLDGRDDPWRRFAGRHRVGVTVQGRVAERVPGGVWLDLGDEVTGFLPDSAAAPGALCAARVVRFDAAQRTLELAAEPAAD